MIHRRVPAAALGAVLLLTGGCTTTHRGAARTVTVVVPAPTTAPATVSSPTPRHSGPPLTTTMSKLPGRCDQRLQPGLIDTAAGHPVRGRTVFVVGLPDASIGRLGYINCQYGAAKGADATVTIQVSLYRTPAKASARIKPTVDAYTQAGAKLHRTSVLGVPAVLLVGGTGAGNGPTALLAVGQRTVVVSLRSGAFPSARVNSVLTALATLATRRTSAH